MVIWHKRRNIKRCDINKRCHIQLLYFILLIKGAKR